MAKLLLFCLITIFEPILAGSPAPISVTESEKHKQQQIKTSPIIEIKLPKSGSDQMKSGEMEADDDVKMPKKISAEKSVSAEEGNIIDSAPIQPSSSWILVIVDPPVPRPQPSSPHLSTFNIGGWTSVQPWPTGNWPQNIEQLQQQLQWVPGQLQQPIANLQPQQGQPSIFWPTLNAPFLGSSNQNFQSGSSNAAPNWPSHQTRGSFPPAMIWFPYQKPPLQQMTPKRGNEQHPPNSLIGKRIDEWQIPS